MPHRNEGDVELLRARHRGWTAPETHPAMANLLDRHDRLGLSNRSVQIDGTPVILVSGEIHFSRVPRDEWDERLRLMKSGGITVVATYVFWLHHEPTRNDASFEGNRDLAAFVELCASLDLWVVVRIGPWCHGEVRNGGFPDWVQNAAVLHRTNDADYLAMVDEWFGRLGGELAPLCGPTGSIIGIQIENEIYDQPDHIRTLKDIARRHGMTAPLYTATAWGGAELPEGEVLPLFGGYGDGFWVDADAHWDDSFREHFFFSHVWDDPGIGADLRLDAGILRVDDDRRLPSAHFPAATCELGGGMATAYHRRPLLSALDIAAVAHNKLGNGSAWQGYYMYAGGVNPAGHGGTQESQATGYPNDLPRFDYDFHAPIGAAGILSQSHAELRRQHAFLAAFGAGLATMPSTLPERLPGGTEDSDTLRWALRSDGSAGYLFITWQQPHVPLERYVGARFRVELDDVTLTLPSAPIDIPVGTIAHWPVNLEVSGVRIRWVTASPLTLLTEGARTVCVLSASSGIDVELAVDSGAHVLNGETALPLNEGIITLRADAPTVYTVQCGEASVDLLILPAALAAESWVLETARGRELLCSAAPLWVDAAGNVASRGDGIPAVSRFVPALGHFVAVNLESVGVDGESVPPLAAEGRRGIVVHTQLAVAQPVPQSYGSRDRRAAAPGQPEIDALAARWEFEVATRSRAAKRTLHIDWVGDVAVLCVDGVPVLDRFWDGSTWHIDLEAIPEPSNGRYLLQILPLHHSAAVSLPRNAEARRGKTTESQIALESLSLSTTSVWTEVR